jgi:hypothetical protein
MLPLKSAQCRSPHPQTRLSADHADFVHEQAEHGGEGEPCRGSVAAEKVQRNTGPATAGCDEDAADIRHGGCGRKTGALKVPEPEDFAQSPHDDEELNRDPELSPSLSGHRDSSIM